MEIPAVSSGLLEYPDVVCVGMITPARVMVVDSLPDWNTGTSWELGAEFVSDDAAIVAGLLSSWGGRARLIGTALGDDDAGRGAIRMLRELGVEGEFELRTGIETPFEIDISDAAGGRTYLWNRRTEILATLDEADLSSIGVSDDRRLATRLLYADWYDMPHNLRAIRRAADAGIPVMLNLEHAHADGDMLDTLLPHVDICQATTDAAQIGSDAQPVAELLLGRGVDTALVTLAAGGAVGATVGEALYAQAPALPVIDTCGAGATFSAEYIRSRLAGEELEGALRSAVAAASLGCTVVGPTAFPRARVDALAESLTVRRLA